MIIDKIKNNIIINIYLFSIIVIILTVIRDYFLFNSNNGNSILGDLIVLNIIASIFTDYISNNRNWISKKITFLIIVINLILISIDISEWYFLVIIYVLGSVGYAYSFSKNVMNGNFSFPVKVANIELILQIIYILYDKNLNIQALIVIRNIFSIILFFLCYKYREENQTKQKNKKTILLQIISSLNLLMLAQANKYFFNSEPIALNVIFVRVTAYFSSAFLAVSNIFANWVAKKINNKNYNNLIIHRCGLILISLCICQFIIIANFSITTIAIITIIVSTIISTGIRIYSRLI